MSRHRWVNARPGDGGEIMAVFLLGERDGEQLLIFNLRANVGPACVNNKDEIELVQFGFFAAAQNGGFTPELSAAFARVVPGASYAGAADDPLTLAIRDYQRYLGGPQDGHVSVMRGPVPIYAPNHPFMLAFLLNNIRD